MTSDFGCKVVLSASFLKSDTEKTIKQAKRLTKWSPLFVHAVEIKTHEQFFNFTQLFSLFKHDKFMYHMYSHLSKVFGNVKKSLYNQPKPYFFKTILWSHFWINVSIFYTKTFGIVHILCVYLFIMFIWVVFICTSFCHDFFYF